MVAVPRQFDVCVNLGANKQRVPFLLVLQHSSGNLLDTRLAVPLVDANKRSRLIDQIEPVIQVQGAGYAAIVAQLRAVLLSEFGPVVAHAGEQHRTLTNAVDFLVTGY